MLITFAERVYDTLCGNLVESAQIPGVENLFSDNAPCQISYERMLDAYARIRERLNCGDEDQDVEVIINELLRIGKLTGLKMFEYGARFGRNK